MRWAYASSKTLDEFLALAHLRRRVLPVAVARLFNSRSAAADRTVRDGRAAICAGRSKERTIEVHGDGTQSRCFGHVTDVVGGLTNEVLETPECFGRAINLGSNAEVTIKRPCPKRADRRLTGSKERDHAMCHTTEVYGAGLKTVRRRVPSLEKAEPSRQVTSQPEPSMTSSMMWRQNSVRTCRRNKIREDHFLPFTFYFCLYGRLCPVRRHQQAQNMNGDGIPNTTSTARKTQRTSPRRPLPAKAPSTLTGHKDGTCNIVFDLKGYASGVKFEVEVKDGKTRDLGGNLILMVRSRLPGHIRAACSIRTARRCPVPTSASNASTATARRQHARFIQTKPANSPSASPKGPKSRITATHAGLGEQRSSSSRTQTFNVRHLAGY